MVKRNKFSLSHYKLLTMNMGELIPIMTMECLPSDSIRQQSAVLVRAGAVPLAPLMHPVMIRIHTFDVPIRLIWEDWEDFITGGELGTDASVHPTIEIVNPAEGSLADYFGIPVGTYTKSFSALPFRAYALIYNEFYRDSQLVTPLTIDLTDGADTTTSTAIKKVAWEKDFFTTARPYQQLGSDITIPLGTDAPVISDGDGKPEFKQGATTGRKLQGFSASADAQWDGTFPANADVLWDDTKLVADLSAATGLSVTALREYFALQRYAEDLNAAGGRYVEYLMHQWGVKQAARLQEPIYIGGGKKVMQFSEVLAKGGTDAGSNSSVGALRGHGIGAVRTRRTRNFVQEHSIRMTLMSMVPKAIYADGINRMWLRSTKEDYFTKQLELIGDRAIANEEVYAEHSSPAGTFGYQHRYDSYRSGNNLNCISGEFNSALNYWHYARMFSGDTALNETFITCNPTKRQYADNTNDSFYVLVNNSIQARRNVAKFPRKRII